MVENLAFVDILSGGRVMIGLGSGYRPYEFAGFGRDFAAHHDRQEEALALILELLHTRRTTHQGPSFHATIVGEYEVFPVSIQQPHPPLFMAAGTDRSMAYAVRHGFGLMLSTLPSFETLARQVRFYRAHVQEAPAPLDQNPACGNVDVARWVVVYLPTADKYRRLTRLPLTGAKRPRRGGSHGLPAALSPLWTPSTPAVWTHVAGSGPLPVPFPTTLLAHTPAGWGHGGTRNSSTSRSVHT